MLNMRLVVEENIFCNSFDRRASSYFVRFHHEKVLWTRPEGEKMARDGSFGVLKFNLKIIRA